MPNPIVVTISHQLGRGAAKRRLDDGIAEICRQLAPFTEMAHDRVTDLLAERGVFSHRLSKHRMAAGSVGNRDPAAHYSPIKTGDSPFAPYRGPLISYLKRLGLSIASPA